MTNPIFSGPTGNNEPAGEKRTPHPQYDGARSVSQASTRTDTEAMDESWKKEEAGERLSEKPVSVGDSLFQPAIVAQATGSMKESGLSQPSLQQAESRNLEQQTPPDAEEPEPAQAPATKAPEEQRTRLETTIIMGALCSALFLAALDVTIITTAVPTIASEFNSNLGYTWIGSAFILANGAFVPIWGKVSDIWGRKPILLVATAVFFVGSLLCGVSVNMGMLIASRAIQGVGGGGILALVNICISDLFSIRSRGFYFSIIGMVWAISSAIGPVLGGVFTTELTWRWCFYINLPICGVAFVLLVFFLKLHNPRTPINQGLAAIDWLGSLTIVGGTVMFLLGLEFGGIAHPWASPTVLCLLIFGVAVVGIFLFIEAKVAHYPIVPLALFRGRNNIGSLLVAYTHSTVFLSGSYYLPLYFQGVLGVSSLKSGVYILPFVIALSVVSGFIGLIIKATGNYKIGIVVGMLIMTLGIGLFIDLDAHSSMAKIILYQIVAGLGVGPNFQSPLIAFQAGVEPRDIASATTTFAFMRQIAGTISIVIGGAIFNNEMQKQYPQLVEKLGPELADRLSGANAAASVALVDQMDPSDRVIAREAYAKALEMMYIVYVAFGAVGVAASLLIRQKKLSKEHTEHKTGLKTLRSREAKKAK
ncbi:hypothetical protein jhhlp_005276 [Lomentospora prolificans]|uniref:Efflux pump dotC n=1 Tax=Lomentospora prolificans TaxID=41688 RepID=A0A2N3N7H1_9PEZI|nr:hypothetical protein jhhlp_005276 [Lomentospora prolificans]